MKQIFFIHFIYCIANLYFCIFDYIFEFICPFSFYFLSFISI